MREADNLEGYAVQGTYKPKRPGKVEAFLAAQIDRSPIVADFRRMADEQKNGHILGYKTLDEAVRAFSKAGYEIVYKDATTCQMKQGKRFRGWGVLAVGVLSAGTLLIPAALQQAAKHDKIILLSVDAEGRVRAA